MNFTTRPVQRKISQCLFSRSIPRRHNSAVAATTSNLTQLLPEQLQYGKPNKPSPPSTHKRLDQIHANIPTYPHPRKYQYKKSNLGLYGNLMLRTGNTISKQNEHKHRRIWKPNIHRKRLWSQCLNRFIRVKVATRVIRTVDKVGGLDNYLLGNRPGRIRELGMGGWALRWRVLRTPMGRARTIREREKLGLQGEPMWMGLPFASKWLAAFEQKQATMESAVVASPPAFAFASPIPVPMEAEEALGDEAAAVELERQIDEEFDMDDEAALRGEDGGIALGDDVDGHSEKKKDL